MSLTPMHQYVGINTLSLILIIIYLHYHTPQQLVLATVLHFIEY